MHENASSEIEPSILKTNLLSEKTRSRKPAHNKDIVTKFGTTVELQDNIIMRFKFHNETLRDTNFTVVEIWMGHLHSATL